MLIFLSNNQSHCQDHDLHTNHQSSRSFLLTWHLIEPEK